MDSQRPGSHIPCDLSGASFRAQLELLGKEYERVCDSCRALADHNSALSEGLRELGAHGAALAAAGGTSRLRDGLTVRADSLDAGPMVKARGDACFVSPDGEVVSFGRDSNFSASSAHIDKLQDLRGSRRIVSSSYGASPFPEWFDPGFDSVRADLCTFDVLAEFSAIRESGKYDLKPEFDPFILSPIGWYRIIWDGLITLCFLVELFINPFEIVFLSELELPILRNISLAVAICFSLDILLNFNSGFIDGDVICGQRGPVMTNYLFGFFIIDLAAAIPFDQAFPSGSGGVFSFILFGKAAARATNTLRTLRYLKLLRAVRMLRQVKHAGVTDHCYRLLYSFSSLAKPLQAAFLLVILAHINGCIWAALRTDWEANTSIEQAIRRYIESFCFAYIAIAVGALGEAAHPGGPKLWIFEVVLASERIFLILYFALQTIFSSLCLIEDARANNVQRNAMIYLKQHKASFATQAQVLYSLRDTGQARRREKNFDELLSNDLPLELRRTICVELWDDRLRTLGLISRIQKWNDSFIMELAQTVREEVLPSQTILFKAGDASIAAYQIIDGEVIVGRKVGSPNIASFTKGMWVGESALVSSLLRRSRTLVTHGITLLMVVKSDPFRALISSLGLMEDFQIFCSTELWKGLCGRCGELGNHFSDSCTLGSSDLWTPGSRSCRYTWDRSLRARSSQIAQAQDLTLFLVEHKLSWLMPTLADIGIACLSDLKHMDINLLVAGLEQTGLTLTEDEKQVLSPNCVDAFQLRLARRARRTLFHEVSRQQHLVFLSHYKVEAGTEAALMRQELEQMINEDPGSLGHSFDEPIFLDTEDLNNLGELENKVRSSHNLAILLTQGILSRPWCLFEIISAKKHGARVLLVNISKPGSEFVFPDDEFYERLLSGRYLDKSATEMLEACGYTLRDVEESIRVAFRQIAVVFSPHKAKDIRQAEIRKVLKQCWLKSQ